MKSDPQTLLELWQRNNPDEGDYVSVFGHSDDLVNITQQEDGKEEFDWFDCRFGILVFSDWTILTVRMREKWWIRPLLRGSGYMRNLLAVGTDVVRLKEGTRLVYAIHI